MAAIQIGWLGFTQDQETLLPWLSFLASATSMIMSGWTVGANTGIEQHNILCWALLVISIFIFYLISGAMVCAVLPKIRFLFKFITVIPNIFVTYSF